MKLRSLTLSSLCLAGLLVGGIAAAQGKPSPPPPPPPPAGPPMPGPAEEMDGDEGGHGGRLRRELAEALYPVGLVRRYSHEIKLTQEQMKRLRDLVTTTSAKVEAIKWDLESESGKLTDMVKAGEGKPKVEQQLGKVLSLENTLKTKHLSLLLDVRDALTQAQRQQLDKVKAEFFASHPGRGPRNMGPGNGKRGNGPGAPY